MLFPHCPSRPIRKRACHFPFVLSWSLSLTMELEFCLEALARALRRAQREIFNSDQGVQFTSERFTGELERRGISISMDGGGRCFDNIFIERLWRSFKYEEFYLNEYERVSEARGSIERWFEFYNHRRPHQSLGYRTPAEVYRNTTRQRLAYSKQKMVFTMGAILLPN